MRHDQFLNLIKWSDDQYSYLPWRIERTLYKTLVSEIMLQQTTVGTVLNFFEKFMDEYPTIFDLAKSSEEQVCISWKGLGYYRRARNLRNLAIMIVEQFKGEIPTELDILLQLKGIGPYTANALVAIGADLRGLAVDANLERVLARLYGIPMEKGPKLQKKFFDEFNNQKIMLEMNKLSPRKINEALMDLGRVLCQARKASCSLCPLNTCCLAFSRGDPLKFPLENEQKKKSNDLFIKLLRVVVVEEDKILFYQKNNNEWLSGQWELPTFIFETNDEKLKQYPVVKKKKVFDEAIVLKTSITKYSINNYIVGMNLGDFETLTKNIKLEYVFRGQSETLNLSTSSIKALKLFKDFTI